MITEEQIIKFETAKLAKEKGFDLFTYLEYTNEGNLIKSSFCSPHRLCSAPTQGLLQKLLREQVNIFVTVELKWLNGYNFTIQEAYYKDYPKGTPSNFINIEDFIEDDDVFNTYEEALEEGLIKALKLIK